MSHDSTLFKGVQYTAHSSGFNTSELANMIEAAYLARQRPTKFTKKTSFAPSGVGYGKSTCARYWYHAFTGAEFDESATDAQNIASMAAGTDAGIRLATIIEATGLKVEKEVEIRYEDPPIHGYMDITLEWDGRTIPGEIKTTRQEMFILRQNSMKPPLYNLFQILIYMKVTGKDIGFLLYENKNDQTLIIIPISWTPTNVKLLDDAFEWMRLVRKTWEDGDVPNRGFPTKRNKNCRNCPVRETCWSDDAPESTVVIPLMATPRL